MKRKLTMFCLLIVAALAYADQVTINTATLNPGGSSVKVTVSLEGTRAYTSYNMDITLPEGWEVELKSSNQKPRVSMAVSGGLYPLIDEDEPALGYAHTLSCSYGEIGTRVLRVACISTSNESFQANSGSLFEVYLKASPYAKPGNPDISLTATDFATYDSQSGVVTPYHFTDAVSNSVTVSTSATAPVAISASLWSTCVLTFDAAIPAGVMAYTCDSIVNDVIYLNEAASLAAYTPYILRSAAAFSGSVSGTVDPANYPVSGFVSDASGILHGAILPQSITAGYVLQQDPNEDAPAFYDINGEAFIIPEGKCWLTVPAGVSAPAIRFVIGVVTDNSRLQQSVDAPIYNVLGMPIAHPIKGQVYIQNGEKFLQTK